MEERARADLVESVAWRIVPSTDAEASGPPVGAAEPACCSNGSAPQARLAFAALQTVETALPEYHARALGRLGRTAEADTEASRAYLTEWGRRWFRHNPHGADVVAVATKVANMARERTVQYLLAARLEQQREQAAARTEQTASAPWTDRLPELAMRPLDDEATRAVIT